MRYSFAPIEAHRGDTQISVIADKVGVTKGTVQKWRDRGMEEHNADAVATALGLHPWQLWPEMLAVATAPVMRECERPACFESFVLTRSDKRFCSDRCRRAMRDPAKAAAWARERYWSDPEHRAAKVAARREYAAEARDTLNAAQRRYYRDNVELERERKRAAYRAKKQAAA